MLRPYVEAKDHTILYFLLLYLDIAIIRTKFSVDRGGFTAAYTVCFRKQGPVFLNRNDSWQ